MSSVSRDVCALPLLSSITTMVSSAERVRCGINVSGSVMISLFLTTETHLTLTGWPTVFSRNLAIAEISAVENFSPRIQVFHWLPANAQL